MKRKGVEFEITLFYGKKKYVNSIRRLEKNKTQYLQEAWINASYSASKVWVDTKVRCDKNACEK